MPITANPTVVDSSVWSLRPNSTMIIWDTGSNAIEGIVFRILRNQRPTTFDEGTKENRRDGKKESEIAIGKTYTFELRRRDNNALLDSVVVIGREKLSLPMGVPREIWDRVPLTQGIYHLRVYPGVDNVRITFRTRQPALPFIEIKDVVTGDFVAPIVSEPAEVVLSHDHLFPLQQSSSFTLQITAFSAPDSFLKKPARASGSFQTGSRTLTVYLDKLQVTDDGDPGMYGAGDFYWAFGVGDVDTQAVRKSLPFEGSISDEDPAIMLNQTIQIHHATARVWLQAVFLESDYESTFAYSPYPEFAPEQSTWHLEGEFEILRITKWVDLNATLVSSVTPFTLNSGRQHIQLNLSGRLEVTSEDGVMHQASMVQKQGPAARRVHLATLNNPGEQATIGYGHRNYHLEMAADSSLFCRIADAPHSSRVRLCDLVPSPTIVVASERSLALFGLGPEGYVLYRAIPHDMFENHVSGFPDWISLGGEFAALIVAECDRDGTHLVGLDRDGVVLHSRLSDRVGPNWRKVGGAVTKLINVVSLSPSEVAILATGRNREILHTSWLCDGPAIPDDGWQQILLALEGTIVAELIDDVLVLAAVCDDETVYVASWAEYPDPKATLEWRFVGTIDAFLDSGLSLAGFSSNPPIFH